MFYCDKCREEKGWPNSFVKSRGSCEVCGDFAVCSDVPSKNLPFPKDLQNNKEIIPYDLCDTGFVSNGKPIRERKTYKREWVFFFLLYVGTILFDMIKFRPPDWSFNLVICAIVTGLYAASIWYTENKIIQ